MKSSGFILPDKLNLLLGLAIFASPYVFGFADVSTAATNAYMVGGLLVLVCLVELIAFRIWEEAIAAAAGAWMIIAPFMLGFNTMGTPTVIHFAAGLLIVLFTVWSTSDHILEDGASPRH